MAYIPNINDIVSIRGKNFIFALAVVLEYTEKYIKILIFDSTVMEETIYYDSMDYEYRIKSIITELIAIADTNNAVDLYITMKYKLENKQDELSIKFIKLFKKYIENKYGETALE